MVKRVNISLEEELWQEVREACLKHKISASKVIARLLDDHLTFWANAETEPTPHEGAPDDRDRRFSPEDQRR